MKRKVICSCMNDTYEKTYDKNYINRPVWKCLNCGKETKRIEKTKRINRTTITKSPLHNTIVYICNNCSCEQIHEGYKYCPECGKKIAW